MIWRESIGKRKNERGKSKKEASDEKILRPEALGRGIDIPGFI